MTEIFVSHAVADRELAELLVDFLADAVGVDPDGIFCSSLAGHGAPLAYDFNKSIRSQVSDPKIFIPLMTPAYMDSRFCLMELGAAWLGSFFTLPIVVPPITFDVVTSTIGLIQAWQIDKETVLEDFRNTVIKALGIAKPRSNQTFNRKSERFRAELLEIMSALPASPKVERDLLENALSDLGKEQATNKQIRKKLEVLEARLPTALIIESEPVISMDLENMLIEAGFSVTGVAASVSEAQTCLRRMTPDVILSEAILKDQGKPLKLLASVKNCVVIFITAYADILLEGPSRPERTVLVQKPFDRKKLSTLVQQHYRYLQNVREGIVDYGEEF